MPAEIVENELSRRVAALSPARRAMLRQMMSSTAAISPDEEIAIQSRDGRRDFPLSAAQERMWFNHQWNPGQPLYNESFGLSIHGVLELGILQQSFDLVMARHEIFFTTFHSAEGNLFQRIGSGVVPRMEIFDLRDVEESQIELTYQAESQRILRSPFRLEEGPLFRAGVWICGENDYRLIFSMHHIIFDGWSGSIFLREMLTVYTAMIEGRVPELPAVQAQYADFAVWEKSRLENSSAELKRQEEYWKKQLDGMAGPPALPIDHVAPDGDAHLAGREIFQCPPAMIDTLKTFVQESGATLFMALLAIFQLLLARYANQSDIAVGIPTTNRNRSAVQNMVGVFINTAILRTDISEEISFRELLGRVRSTTLDAQANQELPFQSVVRLLGLQGDSGRSLLRVLFDVQKKSGSTFVVPGLTIEPMDVGSGFAKFDLVLAMEETDTEFKGILDYDREKFEVETARQLIRHFIALLESAVLQPDVPVNRLPMLSDDEILRARMQGPNTANGFRPPVYEKTVRRAQENPNAIALVDGNLQCSYGEMYERAMRLAMFLSRRGVGNGQHVVIFLPPGLDFVIAQFAVMLTGAAFVPIDVAYPQARVEFMIRDSAAKFAIVNDKSQPSLPEPTIAILPDRDCPQLDPDETIDASMPSGNDPAYLIYTSGSTGQPKGVSVSHAAFANLVAWHRRAFAISSRDRGSQIASIAFDASILEIWPYLAAGASVHFLSRNLMSNPKMVRDWLVKNEITVSFAPTSLAEDLIALQWPPKGKLRSLLTGGDRLRKRPAASLPFSLVNNYGPTENTVVSTSGPVVPDHDGAAPAIGRPIDNVWVAVVNGALQMAPLGGQGELVVGGGSLAIGYWRRPEITSEKFVMLENGERAYRTGDICRFRRSGEIEYLGRIDTQVKLRGCRIELGEIESALLEHSEIRDTVADVRELSNGQMGIVAYVVPNDRMPEAGILRSFLNRKLTSYMMPSSFIQIESVPKTTSGKIDRKRLPSPDTVSVLEGPKQLPQTETEKEIADIWRSLLMLDEVSLQDDFFHMGGDSLLATRLSIRIRERFSIDLPLSQMMNDPTVRALAAFVDGRNSPCVATLPDGLVLLHAAQHESLAPLFFTPPASGSPVCYAAMVDAFSDHRTVYGFEAPGLTDGRPVGSVTGQAQRYVEILNSVYPCGPCFLAGWSLGGPVAFEMACQLRAGGRDVAYLGLIDAGLPENGRLPGGVSMAVPLWWAISYPFSERIPFNYRTIRMLARWMGIALPETIADVWRRGLVAGSKFTARILMSGWRSLRVLRANLRGFRTYQPGFFDGDVTLFRTAQGGGLDNGKDAVRKGLGRYCRHVSVHDAPGSHMTLMLDPGISSAFALSFRATLDIIAPGSNTAAETPAISRSQLRNTNPCRKVDKGR